MQKQEDIARLIGVALNTYNFKENGKKPFTLNGGQNYIGFFNTTIDELFFKRNSKL